MFSVISGGASKLDAIPDVNITAVQNGQGLVWNTAQGKWINANIAGGGSSALSGLTDITITSIADKNYLRYDSATSKWVNISNPFGDLNISTNRLNHNTNLPYLEFLPDALGVTAGALKVVNPSLVVGGTVDIRHESGNATVLNTKGDLEIKNDELAHDINIKANAINLRNDANSIVARMFNSHLNLPEGFYASFGGGSAGPLQIVRNANLSQISSNANKLLIWNSSAGQFLDLKGSDIRLLDNSDNLKLKTTALGVNLPQDQTLTFGNADQLQITRNSTNSLITNILGDLRLENSATNAHVVVKLGTSSNATAFKIRTDLNSDVFEFRADGSTNIGLGTLNGVVLTSPANGQVLSYNSATSQWVNSSPSGGGSTGSIVFNGADIGISTDTDLMTVANNQLTLRNSLRILEPSTNRTMTINHNGSSGSNILVSAGGLLIQTQDNVSSVDLRGRAVHLYNESGTVICKQFNNEFLMESNYPFVIGNGAFKIRDNSGVNSFAATSGNVVFDSSVSGSQIYQFKAGSTMALSINSSGACNIPNLTQISDQRDKTDISLADIGLLYINKLKVYKFKYDLRQDYIQYQTVPILDENGVQTGTQEVEVQGIPDGSKKSKLFEYGVIAQEAMEHTPPDTKIVVGDEKQYTIAYTQLIPIMLKAIQELTQKVAVLEEQMAAITTPPN